MSFSKAFINELKNEAANTKKLLERIPDDKLTWKPHEKSMPLGRLAVHVAQLPSWTAMTVNTDSLNLADMNYTPPVVTTNKELLDLVDKNVNDAITALETVSEEELMKPWKLSNGEHVIFELPKAAVIRSMSLNHLVHHRAQIGVYLRLNDVHVPGMYGPSADEK